MIRVEVFLLGCLAAIFAAAILVGYSISGQPTGATASPRASQHVGLQGDGPILLGDSLTDHGRWREIGLPALNYGIGRDTVAQVTARLSTLPDRGMVFVMVGINDLQRGRTVDQIIDDYDQLLWNLTGRRVVVQSVIGPDTYPIPELNTALAELADRHGVEWLDLTPAFGHPIREDFTYDGIHLTGTGYAAWVETIRSEL